LRFRWWRRDGKDADGRPEQAAHGASSARLRYHAFQHILYTNNRALELLARIETLSDQGGVTLPEARSLVRDLVRMTSDLVQSLNVMTGGREGKLMETARRICQPIMEALAEPLFRPDAPLVLDLDQVSYRQVTLAGNKATALAEAARVLPEGLRVPPGFVLTVRAEKIFLESNNLESSIDEMLSGVKDPNDPRFADLCEKNPPNDPPGHSPAGAEIGLGGRSRKTGRKMERDTIPSRTLQRRRGGLDPVLCRAVRHRPERPPDEAGECLQDGPGEQVFGALPLLPDGPRARTRRRPHGCAVPAHAQPARVRRAVHGRSKPRPRPHHDRERHLRSRRACGLRAGQDGLVSASVARGSTRVGRNHRRKKRRL
jgi:hypothetical protein